MGSHYRRCSTRELNRGRRLVVHNLEQNFLLGDQSFHVDALETEPGSVLSRLDRDFAVVLLRALVVRRRTDAQNDSDEGVEQHDRAGNLFYIRKMPQLSQSEVQR